MVHESKYVSKVKSGWIIPLLYISNAYNMLCGSEPPFINFFMETQERWLYHHWISCMEQEEQKLQKEITRNKRLSKLVLVFLIIILIVVTRIYSTSPILYTIVTIIIDIVTWLDLRSILGIDAFSFLLNYIKRFPLVH